MEILLVSFILNRYGINLNLYNQKLHKRFFLSNKTLFIVLSLFEVN